jgi:hypothetical protein
MRDVLPAPVYEAVRTHLAVRARVAVVGWEGGSDEEDTLTGDLGGTLRTNWRVVPVDDALNWRWRVRYKKLRGRGRGAFEKTSGADGILQVEATRNSEKVFKGVIFQAKRLDRPVGNLASQVRRMEDLAEGGSAVWLYGPQGYLAVSGSSYLEAGGDRGKAPQFETLSSFLGDTFLPCSAGLRGMYFDAVRGLLVLPNGIVHRVSIGHRIAVEIQSAGA